MPQPTLTEEALCTRILAWADNQELIPGFRLPAERTLAHLFDVPRTTVNRALHMLVTRGVIHQESREIRIWVGERNPIDAGAVVIVNNHTIHPLDSSHVGCGLAGVYQGAVAELRLRNQPYITIDMATFLARPVPESRGVLIFPELKLTDRKSRNALFAAIHRLRIPAVLFADDFTTKELADCRADAVMSDHAAGTEALVRHLHARGRRQIRICLHRNIDQPRNRTREPWVIARIAGWTRACTALGLPMQPPLDLVGLHPAFHLQDPMEEETRLYIGCLAEALLDCKRPDGLLALSDGLAFPMAAACRRLGVIPGQDIDIVGYDHQAQLPFLRPVRDREPTIPHASIDLGLDRIGAKMVQILCRRTAGSLPGEPLHHMMPVELIPGPTHNEPPSGRGTVRATGSRQRRRAI